MAYSDFTGYQAQPNGGYLFERQGGKPVLLAGPQADALAKQLDANPYGTGGPVPSASPDPNPYQDMPGSGSLFAPGSQAVSQMMPLPDSARGGARDVEVSDASAPIALPNTGFSGGNQRGAGQAAAAQRTAEYFKPKPGAVKIGYGANRKPAGATTPSVTLTPEEQAAWDKRPVPAGAPVAPGAQPEPAEQQAQARGPRVVGQGKGKTFYVNENGQLRTGTAGSRGSPGGMTPKAEEVTREGGYQVDKSYLDAEAALNERDRALNTVETTAAMTGAEKERVAFAEAAARDAKRAELQTKATNRMGEEQRYAEASYEQALAEARDFDADPNKQFKGVKGAMRGIGFAIAQALGAYGATIGRTQNFAQQIVSDGINRYVEGQRAEMRVRGANVDNQLANLTRKTGDKNQAELLLRAQLTEYAANKARAEAASTKRQDAMIEGAKLDTALQRQGLQLREAYLRGAQGKATEKVMNEFVRPTAASGPSDQVASLEDQARYEDLQSKRLGNEKVKRGLETGVDETSAPQVKAYQDNMNAVDTGAKDLAKYASAIGAKRNPETGKWEGDVGGVWRTGVGASDRSQGIQAQATTLAPGIARALEGGSAPNADQIKTYTEELTSVSGDKMLATLNSMQERIDSQRDSINSSVDPATVEQRKRRGQAVNRANNTAGLPAPKPVQ